MMTPALDQMVWGWVWWVWVQYGYYAMEQISCGMSAYCPAVMVIFHISPHINKSQMINEAVAWPVVSGTVACEWTDIDHYNVLVDRQADHCSLCPAATSVVVQHSYEYMGSQPLGPLYSFGGVTGQTA